MSTISSTAQGVSPLFTVTAENFILDSLLSLTPVDIDGVLPPWLGDDGGLSYAHTLMNLWFPWIDEKICEPKYDGICKYFGMPSNRPTYIKDYHVLTLFRATDYILKPNYQGRFEATVDGPTAIEPPKGEDQ